MLLGVSSLFVILRSFSVIYRPNTLRFRILSAHLSSTAPDNSPLRGSNKSPQLKLVRTKFTEALLSFGNDISRKFTYSIEPNIVCQRKEQRDDRVSRVLRLCAESQTPLSRSEHRRIKPKRNKGRRAFFRRHSNGSGDAEKYFGSLCYTYFTRIHSEEQAAFRSRPYRPVGTQAAQFAALCTATRRSERERVWKRMTAYSKRSFRSS